MMIVFLLIRKFENIVLLVLFSKQNFKTIFQVRLLETSKFVFVII